MATFGQRLKGLRENKRMTQKEVAGILAVSPSTIVKYENGERTPSPDAIIQLADFFQVSTDYLLGRSDIPDTVEMRISKKEDVTGGLPPNVADLIRDFAEYLRGKYKNKSV